MRIRARSGRPAGNPIIAQVPGCLEPEGVGSLLGIRSELVLDPVLEPSTQNHKNLLFSVTRIINETSGIDYHVNTWDIVFISGPYLGPPYKEDHATALFLALIFLPVACLHISCETLQRERSSSLGAI